MSETLYGGGISNNLVTFSIVDASQTAIGPMGIEVTGMAFHPTTGVLYAVTSNTSSVNPRALYTVDVDTGAATYIGNLNISTNTSPDIAFHSNGTLYGWNAGPGRLITINLTTGQATEIGTGTLSSNGCGLAFDSSDTLYLFTSPSVNKIYTVDLVTGALTFVVNTSVSQRMSAASFSSDDTCYWVRKVYAPFGSVLGTINLTTGAETIIGTIDPSSNWTDAIAWQAVSAPAIPRSIWAYVNSKWTEFSRYGTGDKALWGFAFGEWQQLMRSVETVEPYPWTAVIFKAADRSIGGNSILDDNELFFTTVAGKFYEIDIVVIYSNPTGGTAGGISLGGYESTSQMHGALNIFGTGRVTPIGGWLSTTLTDSTLRGAAGTATNKRVAILRGAHAGAGGIFRFEFCQAVSGASGTPVIVHAGSFLRYRLLN